ncbi:MAG: tetratricopeptide repeat protein [Chloroflexales bacterium]
MGIENISCPFCDAFCRVTARFCPHCGMQLRDAPNSRATASVHAAEDLPTAATADADDARSGTIGAATQRDSSPPPAPHLAGDFSPGAFIDSDGRYRIERTLGKGGFGEAYLAHDLRLDRSCVVKHLVVGSDWSPQICATAVEAFTREAQLLVSLNTPGHPHIPEIYDFFPANRCLVMKHIVGEDLAQIMRQRGAAFSLDEVIQIACEAGSALIYLHSRTPEPVLHRDIKPANLLRDSEGRVWLIDFGLAQRAATLARADLIGGSPGYAPPEQWLGQALPASDIYAFAATLYALLTARSPRESGIGVPYQDSEALSALEHLLPNVPPALSALVRRALLPDPAARPSARAFLDTLEEVREQQRVPPPPSPTRPPTIPGFVGRAAELAALSAELNRDGIVLLTGMPGVGKTSMAAVLALQVGNPITTFWHSFRPGEGTESLIWNLAGFLAHQGRAELWTQLQHARMGGGQAPPLKVLIDYAVQMLDGMSCLLCLDDVHLIDEDPQIGPFMAQLAPLRRAGHLRLIATSRWVPNFALVDQVEMLTGLNAADAARLLAERGVVLGETLQADLYAQVGGNAQLLTLAADALRRSPNPARLVGALTTTDSIERYLLDEIDATLSNEERSTMKPVAALLEPGGTRGAIEALADGVNVRRPLRSLSDRYLLLTQEAAEGKAYHQHAIVQRFYYEELGNRERIELHRRAAAYYEREEPDPLRAALHHLRAGDPVRAAEIGVGQVATAINSGQTQLLRSLLAQIPVERLDTTLAAALDTALGELLALLGEYAEARERLERASAVGERLGHPLTVRANRQRLLGMVLERTSQYEAAEITCRAGLALLEGVSLPDLEIARLHTQLAEALFRQSRYDAAEDACAAGLAALPPAPAAPVERVALLHRQATILMDAGHLSAAATQLEQALPLARQSGSLWNTSAILYNLGFCRYDLGQIAQAEGHYRESLAMKERIGDLSGQIFTLNDLGLIAMAEGNDKTAVTMFQTCLQIAERIQSRADQALSLGNIGLIQIRQGHLDAAVATLIQARDLSQEIGDRLRLIEVLCRLGEAALARNDPASAQGYGQEALALAQEAGMHADEGWALRVLGEALLAQGRLDEAEPQLAAAWDLLEQAGDIYEQTLTLIAQARLAHTTGAASRARSLARQAQELAEDDHDPYLIAALERVTGEIAASQ